jgi:hypothetical protein
MFTFYDFAAAHGVHLRTTNPIDVDTFPDGELQLKEAA